MRVHQTDAHGNLEWVERLIQQQAKNFRRGKLSLTKESLRRLLEQAYRNGACAHGLILQEALLGASSEAYRRICRD